jgi:ribosome maturation factor RimP
LLSSATQHFGWFEMGAGGARFREGSSLADVYAKERELQREIATAVESGLPQVEVLAVELTGPERFCVYVDHPQGVDHALCARVTELLRRYLDRYTVDVSSPGTERPLRTPAHFRNAVGRRVAIRTAGDIGGRKRFRGELLAAGDGAVTVGTTKQPVEIPYDAIVRGNLIDEG